MEIYNHKKIDPRHNKDREKDRKPICLTSLLNSALISNTLKFRRPVFGYSVSRTKSSKRIKMDFLN
jgi:hypothetical protein